MTGSAYMREVLIHEEIRELLDKQVNVQKESLKKILGFTQAPASPRKKCAMKMKEENNCCKIFFVVTGRTL